MKDEKRYARYEEKRPGKKRRNRHVAAKLFTFLIVLLALMLVYCKFMLGRDVGSFLPGKADFGQFENTVEHIAEEVIETDVFSEPTNKPQEKPDYSLDSILSIEIKEDKIYYEGQEVTLQQLEENLLRDYKEGLTVSVTDDHAIKGTYDEVEALLTKLALK